jgi:hypothetical protein
MEVEEEEEQVRNQMAYQSTQNELTRFEEAFQQWVNEQYDHERNIF